jgi:hypothetical protein
MAPLSAAIFVALTSQAATVSGVGRFHIEYTRDRFGMRSHGIIETIGANRTKFYPLPQSTPQEYIRLRPEDFRLNPFESKEYERQEVIGPYQIEDAKIWFGNSYYDSEGMRGVGTFGYFDTTTCKYTLFSPPEIARYETSAILVQPDAVWLALDHFGEDKSASPGGLIRWNRSTHEIRRYGFEFVVSGISVEGDALRFATVGGYALMRNGRLQRYLNSGRPIQKFPPQPSLY